MPHLVLLLSIDSSVIFRPDKSSMTHQTLMELLVSNLDDKKIFRDSGGCFENVGEWDGVAQNRNSEVLEISWMRFYTNDLFDESDDDADVPQKGGSIDLHWLPPTVISVSIPDLDLKGSLDTLELPPKMKRLDIGKNKFEGPLDLAGLPQGFTSLSAMCNKFFGSVALDSLPQKMKELTLSKNSFSGTICLNNLPVTLVHLYLSKNSLSGPLDLSKLPESLKYLGLEENDFGVHDVLTVPTGALEACVLDAKYFHEVQTVAGTRLDCLSRKGEKSVRVFWPRKDDIFN